jgi:dTDP-4-dehydrorhamnose reductase
MGSVSVIDNVAIFGSAGQLGSDIAAALQASGSYEVIPLTHEIADCTDADAVRRAVLHARPQFVINCAAYVRVDDCEDHACEAFNVNAIGALNIARACTEIDACCVYISTDYVFDGKKKTPYVESDPTNPINVYGTSKLAGEYLVRQTARRWLIVRVASLFGKSGARGKGGNFIETILAKAKKGEALRVVNDIRISPTYTFDAAKSIAVLLKLQAGGIVHLSNRGSCTWYEFAKAALDFCHVDHSISAVPGSAFPMRARRPINSALDSTRGADFTFQLLMPTWHQALQSYLLEKGRLQSAPTAAVG